MKVDQQTGAIQYMAPNTEMTAQLTLPPLHPQPHHYVWENWYMGSVQLQKQQATDIRYCDVQQ